MATPDTITGLHAWWKADAIPGLADGANVASWPDSSSNGFTATQATGGSQPTYKVGIVNGLPVVRYPAAKAMNAGASASLSTSTVLAVVKLNDTSTRTIVGASSAGGLQLRFSGGVQMLKQSTAAIATSNTTGSTSAFVVYTATFVGGGSGSYAFYRNGTADGAGSHAQTLTSSLTVSIGANGGGSENMNGDIAEIIIYDSVLSAGNRAIAHSYLSDKYAITVSDYVSGAAPPPDRPQSYVPRRRAANW